MRPSRKAKIRYNYRDLEQGKLTIMSDNEMDIPNHTQGMSDSEEEIVSDEEWLSLSEEQFQEEVNVAMEEEDEGKLSFLLKMKEKRCAKLQKELKKSEKEEQAKKKRMRDWEEKFKKLNKTETSLSKTLNSRSNTPNNSPKKAAGIMKKTSVKKPGYTPRTKTRFDFQTPAEKRGELPSGSNVENKEVDNAELLNMLLELKQGKRSQFNELLAKSREADSNITMLQGGSKSPLDSNCGDNSREVTIAGTLNRSVKDINSQEGRGQLLRKLHEFTDNTNTVSNTEQQKERRELVEAINTLARALDRDENGKAEGKEEKDGKKKLVSGKTTKPDESDIKKQIKFAHEKLDPRHVKDRIFDTLSASLLVAGELELALQKNITEDERLGRISIAKTVCYHQKYLPDDDLRVGYDTILKRLEQGEEQWSAKLGEDLHVFYDYRANVLLREKTTSDKSKQKTVSSENDKKEEEGDETKEGGRIIYCMEYNLGKCAFDKSHKGKFRGKTGITKWHVCKACLKHGDLEKHAEKDGKCPNRG